MMNIHMSVYAKQWGTFPADIAEMLAALTLDMVASVNLYVTIRLAIRGDIKLSGHAFSTMTPHFGQGVSLPTPRRVTDL
jgi:hypothetical protein